MQLQSNTAFDTLLTPLYNRNQTVIVRTRMINQELSTANAGTVDLAIFARHRKTGMKEILISKGRSEA